ncbi:MAG: hypothetical protein ACRCT2_10965 [Plesiomonas shigelloides]
MNWLFQAIGGFFANLLKSLAIYYKGQMDAHKDIQIENLKADVEAVKKLQDVKINTERNAALERLRKHGKVRD